MLGGSYGGFMVTSLMCKHPDVFKVGVCGGPVIDWSMYEIMYTERYMDMPKENPEGYKASNLLNYADKLQGKLLMIHGTSDVHVPFSATMKMVKAFIRAGKFFDLIVLPGETHLFTETSARYMSEAIRRYFQEHLKP